MAPSSLGMHSRNITVENTAGFLRRSDPEYTNLPAEPEKPLPPAPIDASSTFGTVSACVVVRLTDSPSQQMVLHLLGANVNARRN